jgi:hypothetical protein
MKSPASRLLPQRIQTQPPAQLEHLDRQVSRMLVLDMRVIFVGHFAGTDSAANEEREAPGCRCSVCA